MATGNELIGYLPPPAGWVLHYARRRMTHPYTGSAHVAQAHTVIVARQHKHRGMH